MELQTIFYIVAIAMMLTIIISFILIGIAIWKIKQQAAKFPAIAKTALAGFAIAKRQQIMGTAGLAIGTALLSKLKEQFFDSSGKQHSKKR